MNWRRGIVFALIHARIVMAFIVREERHSWPRANIRTHADESVQPVAWQEEQTIAFDPCNGGMVDGTSRAEDVVAFGNFPTMAITGWPSACPQRSPVAKFSERVLHTRGRGTESAVHVIVEIVVIVEWLLIGGFPLARRSGWWREPGAFITICTVAGFVLAMIPPATPLIRLFLLAAFAGWIWWLLALLLKGVRAIRSHHLARA